MGEKFRWNNRIQTEVDFFFFFSLDKFDIGGNFLWKYFFTIFQAPFKISRVQESDDARFCMVGSNINNA